MLVNHPPPSTANGSGLKGIGKRKAVDEDYTRQASTSSRFSDGKRLIDFVLAYSDDEEEDETDEGSGEVKKQPTADELEDEAIAEDMRMESAGRGTTTESVRSASPDGLRQCLHTSRHRQHHQQSVQSLREKRRFFEHNLQLLGLELEHVSARHHTSES